MSETRRRATAHVPRKPSPREAAAVREIVAAVLAAEKVGAESPYPESPCVCRHAGPGHSGASGHGRCRADGCACRKYRADLLHVAAGQILASRGRRFADEIREWHMLESAKRPPRKPLAEGEWFVFPSDLGGCGRKIAYRNGLGGDVERDWSDRGAAEAGGMVEDFKRTIRGTLYPWLLFQVPLQIQGISRSGKADEIDPYLGIISDDKSKGEGAWRRLGDEGPSKADWGQVCLYAAAWEAAGSPVTAVRIVGIRRDNLQEETFERPWDDTRRRWAEEARAELVARQVQLDISAASGDLPPRDFGGPSSSYICANCDYRSTCWDIPRARSLGRSPESLDRFGADPADAEVDALLGQVRAAYEARRAASEQVDKLKILIDGLPPRAYGDNRIVSGRAGSPLWGQYAKALVEYAEAQGVDCSDVPVPMGSQASPSVRPVRAAVREARALNAAAASAALEADPLDPPASPVPPQVADSEEGVA